MFASPPVINNRAASSEADEICKVSVLATTLPVPCGVSVKLPFESVVEIVLPFILILSTLRAVKVPTEVTFAKVSSADSKKVSKSEC